MENERFDEIIQYLKENKSAKVETLAKLLFTSEATIRRDLKKMQALGLVERVHGGAFIEENSGELSHFVRSKKNESAKREIARLAAEVIPSFNTLFVDSSTTALYLLEKLPLTLKTAVTNSFLVAEALGKLDNVNVILLGGKVDGHTSSVLGSFALSQLDEFSFDLAICSCAAVKEGFSFERTLDVADIKKKALSKSKRKLLLSDAEKFFADGAFRCFPLSSFDFVVTDKEPPKSVQKEGVRFIYKKAD